MFLNRRLLTAGAKKWAESARFDPARGSHLALPCGAANATLVPGLRRQKPSFYDQPAAIFANQNFQKKVNFFIYLCWDANLFDIRGHCWKINFPFTAKASFQE